MAVSPLLPFLALAAHAAVADPFFDGSRGAARFEPLAGPRGTVRPPRAPTEAEALEILREAGARWSHAALSARLSPLDPGQTFDFAVVGDAEPGRFFFQRLLPPGGDAYERLLGLMSARAPAFIVQMGDFVSRGTPRAYLRYLELIDGSVPTPIFHVIGNHDRRGTQFGAEDKSLFKALFGETTDRVLDRGDWRLVFLDNADYGVSDFQLDWLDAALEGRDKTIVFMHIPPDYLYKRLDGAGGEPRARDEAAKPPTGYFSAGAERLRAILERRRPKRVYLGHIHGFGAAEDRGVCYVLSAAGGSPLYPVRAHAAELKTHFLTVRVSAEGVTEEMTRLDGSSRLLPGPCPVP
jgi:hypothetical protein